jgi:hypothetical protein
MKNRMPQGFARPDERKSDPQSVVAKEQVTPRNSAISVLFRITISVKFPSQMNPLSQSNVSEILIRGNPG